MRGFGGRPASRSSVSGRKERYGQQGKKNNIFLNVTQHSSESQLTFYSPFSKSVENCVCIMRNLSYHVHKEVPGAERFQDPSAPQAPGSAGPHRKKKDDAGCFGGKKAKGESERHLSIQITIKHTLTLEIALKR